VPILRNATSHLCSKPPELLRQLVEIFVPVGGVLLDPFAGAAPMVEIVEELGRRAVLIEVEAAG
jgi:DNA modification methylase